MARVHRYCDHVILGVRVHPNGGPSIYDQGKSGVTTC